MRDQDEDKTCISGNGEIGKCTNGQEAMVSTSHR